MEKIKKFIGSQPITFNKYTYDPSLKYFITHKLDGLRKLLIITDNNIGKLISSKMDIMNFYIPKRPELNNTILDCEYIEQTKKVYVFDILYYKGDDIRNKTLTERLILINNVINVLKSKRILSKKYLSPYDNTLCNNFFNLIQQYSTEMQNGEVDGVIFTPDISYIRGIPLKWKPISLLSIDFKIKKIIDSHNNKIKLLTQSDQLFKPKGKYSNIGIVTLSKQDYNKYSDGDVIEFIFDKGKFKPIKIRKDKIKSNHFTVILSNFKTILNPPNMKKLLC